MNEENLVELMRTPPGLADLLPSLVVGLSFAAVGLLKVYGLSRGVVGGSGKPASVRLCGSCPSWSRRANVALACLFLAIGVAYLAYFAWLVLGAHAPTIHPAPHS
jgi:hypothetical protein